MECVDALTLPIGRSSLRGWVSLVVTAAFLMFVTLPAPASAAPDTRCSSRLSRGHARVGDRVALVGRVSPGGARRVRLELWRHGRWHVIVRGHSSRAGTFRLRVPTEAPGAVKVRADVEAARARRRVSCRARRLVVARAVPYQPSPANSIRAVYALASDQPIRRGKVAAIVSEIGVVNRWFATQTIGRVQPRWARKITAAGSVGDPKVLTVRLAHTAAQYEAAVRGDILDMVEADLAAATPAKSSSERAAVWIDVDSAYACGISRPKELTVFLEASCNIPADLLETWPTGERTSSPTS